MKILSLLCVLLPASAWAYTDAQPPKRTLWEQALTARVDPSDRETIIKLASLVPGFFGLPFVCQFQSAVPGAKPGSVLPGEWLDSPEGGELHCPDSFVAKLEKGTKFRVARAGSLPRFVLERGRLSLQFNQEPFFLETPTFSAAITGQSKGQNILVTAEEKTYWLGCYTGSMAINVDLKAAVPESTLVFSQDCRIEASFGGSPVRHYVAAEDRVELGNLALPRKYWPEIVKASYPRPLPDIANFYNVQVHSSAVVEANPYAPIPLDWLVSGAKLGADCVLLGQKTETEAMVEIAKLQAKVNFGKIMIDGTYRNGGVIMICEDAQGTMASNFWGLAP